MDDLKLTVMVSTQRGLTSTNISKHLKIDIGPGQKKQVFINDRPVSVTATVTTITFSQDKEGIFAKPVVITFFTR